MNVSDARKAHKILDDLFKRKPVLDEEREFLRKSLPELPKQKALAEIIAHVDDAWSVASGNDWGGNSYDTEISIEDWLTELYEQLKGLIDTPVAVPALPAGMRLADHEDFGRVVVSPGVGIDRCHEIFYLDPGMSSGTDISEVEPDSLTFIDAEPAKPAPPEFLETEADYTNAPEGTIVACEDNPPWHKSDSAWLSTTIYGGNRAKSMAGVNRRVLRWGMLNEQL